MSDQPWDDILAPICDDLTQGKDVAPITVRELISWFGAERRGYMVAYKTRKALEFYGLGTVPDFDTVPLGARVRFALLLPPVSPSDTESTTSASVYSGADDQSEVDHNDATSPSLLIFGATPEPAFRVSRLSAANTTLVSVKPDDTLSQAITLMLRHDFSQLPVMTNERDVKGVISWESIGPKLGLTDQKPAHVRDYMVEHNEISSKDSIFSAIPRIVEHSYVLVRSSDKRITGIITTTDLSLQFKQLSEPFLLLSEIENHIRKLIDGMFTKEELQGIVSPSDPDRAIESVADLTFGEYIRLFENPDLWCKTNIKVDRGIFVKELDRIRIIRNNVMHFDPDGISDDDHELLHHFVRFIHDVQKLAI